MITSAWMSICFFNIWYEIILGGVDESEGLNNQLEKILKSYLKSLGQILDMEEEEEDENHKKLLSVLINGVNVICLQLPVAGQCVVKVIINVTLTSNY